MTCSDTCTTSSYLQVEEGAGYARLSPSAKKPCWWISLQDVQKCKGTDIINLINLGGGECHYDHSSRFLNCIVTSKWLTQNTHTQ